MDLLDPVAVLGAGPAACEAARRRAQTGHLVRLWAPHVDALDAAVARIREAVERLVAEGGATAADRQRTLDGILATTDLEEAVRGATVVLDHR